MADSAGNNGQSGLLADAAAAFSADGRRRTPHRLDLVEDVKDRDWPELLRRQLSTAGQQSQVVRSHTQMLSRVVAPDPGHAVFVNDGFVFHSSNHVPVVPSPSTAATAAYGSGDGYFLQSPAGVSLETKGLNGCAVVYLGTDAATRGEMSC